MSGQSRPGSFFAADLGSARHTEWKVTEQPVADGGKQPAPHIAELDASEADPASS